jgi:tetratricopeptide (TPR) repeat protein
MTRSGKRYIKGLPIILLLLFSFCIVKGSGQSTGEALEFAKSQIKEGNYELANKALHRVLFFDTEFSHPEAVELIAESYYMVSDYLNARYYFALASVQSDNDSLKAEFAFKKVLCNLNLEEFQDAKIELLSFEGELTAQQNWSYNLLSGITAFNLEEYDEARKYLVMCTDTANHQIVNRHFDEIHKLERRYNPRTARILSIVLPGSGQFYAGDYKNGINSIALVTGLAAAAATLAVSITFIDAAIVVFPWFQRYYMGGFQRASNIALDKQMTKKKELLLTILDRL